MTLVKLWPLAAIKWGNRPIKIYRIIFFHNVWVDNGDGGDDGDDKSNVIVLSLLAFLFLRQFNSGNAPDDVSSAWPFRCVDLPPPAGMWIQFRKNPNLVQDETTNDNQFLSMRKKHDMRTKIINCWLDGCPCSTGPPSLAGVGEEKVCRWDIDRL